MGKLSENTSYIQPASDFYGEQNFQLDNAESFNKMGSLYNKRLNQVLDKDYDNIPGQKSGDRLLKKVIRDGNKIQFLDYLKYLVNSGQIDSNQNFDDVDQIGDLQDKLISLKEQIEDLGNRDFTISGGKYRGIDFLSSEFKYLGNNIYKVNVDFQRKRISKIGKHISFTSKYNNSNNILIKYIKTPGLEIKIYEGNSQSDIRNSNLIKTIPIINKTVTSTRRTGYNEIEQIIKGETYILDIPEKYLNLTIQFKGN